MFDIVRNNSKLMMGLLFLLVIPSFVLFGIEGYSRFTDKAAVVARVDGQKITQQEWDQAHKLEVDRIRAQIPNVDPQLLDSPQARMATLDRLVNDKVLAVAAQKQLLLISDARLARELQLNPVIAGLRGADGKLDMERYRQLAASQGLTPEGFEHQVRQDLSNRQVLTAVQDSALSLSKPSDTAVQAWLQQREIQLHTLAAKDFASKVQVSDAELQAYYQANADRFRSQETIDVEYVTLDVNALMGTINLPEQDLRSYYEQNLQKLAGQQQRRASHILIAVPKDAPAADREKAKTQARQLLEQVRKNPQTFADVARKNSQDSGSAARGGDLDYFARGAMVKPFEDAVFAMKEGEISDLIETEFGYHIIQLTGIKSAKAPSFEAMRPQLESDLRKQQAQRKFAELAEIFSNTVYEQSDSLQPVADKLKLTVQHASALTRQAGAGMPAVLNHPKLLQALFSEDALVKRRNTEAIETAANTLVAARVVKHQPSAVRPFAEVRDEVTKRFVQSRAADLAKAEGLSLLKSWQDKAQDAQLGATMVVSRTQAAGQPQALVDAALKADPAKLPAWLGVDLGDAGYAVVRVNRIVPPAAMPAEQARLTREQFARLWGQTEAQAYLKALRRMYKAEILVKPGKE